MSLSISFNSHSLSTLQFDPFGANSNHQKYADNSPSQFPPPGFSHYPTGLRSTSAHYSECSGHIVRPNSAEHDHIPLSFPPPGLPPLHAGSRLSSAVNAKSLLDSRNHAPFEPPTTVLTPRLPPPQSLNTNLETSWICCAMS